MGNAVNLAARLEGVNKQYGTWIMTSGSTIAETGGKLLTRRLDRVRVVGMVEPVQLYEVMETAEDAADWQKELAGRFEGGMLLFESRNWQKAAETFKDAAAFAPADQPSKLYYNRCLSYLKNPPPDSWDGVMNLSEK
jgi:adenylate cyclase